MPVKKKRKATPKNIVEEKDTQSSLDDSIIGDVLSFNPTILGKKLNPVTLASIALLKQIKSPLILGKPLNDIDNIILDSCIFILLQSLDLKSATELAFGPVEDLRFKALEMAEEIPPHEVSKVTDAVLSLLRESSSTQVEAKIKDKNLQDSAGNF